MVGVDRRVVIVGVGGDAVFHLEKVVGVAVHIGFRGGGQAHQNRIEIIKNGAVFLENAAVALVHDDKVKMRRGKQRHAVLGLGVVDGVEHGGIGGKHDARGLIVLRGAQVAQRLVGQILFEVVLCLLDQRSAVRQKEHVGHMTAPAQHIGQAGCGAGLACARCHDQQIAPEALRNMGADCPDGVFLIVAVGDFIVNFDGVQRLFLGAAVHQLLQVVLAEHPAHSTLRAALLIPEIGGVAVGGKQHRTAAKLLLQTVCIKLSLLAPDVGVFGAALGFNDRQRQAVLAHQHIVRIALLPQHAVHVVHFVLGAHIGVRPGEFPAHGLEVDIDDLPPSFGLGQVCGGKTAALLVLLFAGCVCRRKALHLLAQRFQLGILLGQQAFLLPDLLFVQLHFLAGDGCFIKGALRIVRAVAVIHPLDEVEQPPQAEHCIRRRHAMPRMYRQIARLHDAGQHAPHIAVHREPEARLMQQGLQVVLVGHRDGLICRIHPLHRQLQRLPAPHCAHRRGGGEHFLGLDGRIGEEGIFGAGGEIGEVGHKISSFM